MSVIVIAQERQCMERGLPATQAARSSEHGFEDTKKFVGWKEEWSELKAQILSECAQPVHKWRRLAGTAPLPPACCLVLPVTLRAPACPAPADIRMGVHRGATTMVITWPAAAAVREHRL